MNSTAPEEQPRQTPQGDTFLSGDTSAQSQFSSSGEPGPPPGPRRSAQAPAHPTGGAAFGPGSRVRRTGRRPDALLDATVRLQPRDSVLTLLLEEHRTLTTTQIAAVLYDSYATARARLYRLRRADWLDRFAVIRATGRLDTHWVLGPLGASWAAGQQQRPEPTAKAARDARHAIAASSHLEHHDGAHQIFIDLLVHARHHPGTRLARWWSPARTAAASGQRVHPDGHGVWEEHDPATAQTTQVGFYLEYDTGTETLTTLKNKLGPYQRLHQDGPDYPLLIWLPSPTREANLHRKLNGDTARLGFTLATTSPAAIAAHPDRITGPVWKIAGNGRPRHRLGDLPSHHGKPGAPYHPGPPTPEQDPLYRLRPE